MFRVVEVKNYDERHNYGVDWVTDYICETDEVIDDIDVLIKKVQECNHQPYGQCELRHQNGNLVLNTRMY